MIALTGVKILSLLKPTAVVVVVVSTAVLSGMPVHDIWFDYVLFVILSAFVGGMPEPDTDLPLPRFIYTWMYRSGHLMVASATAYFLHQKKWDSISDGKTRNTKETVNE